MNAVFFILFTGVRHDAGVLPFEVTARGPGLCEEYRVLKRHCVMDGIRSGFLKSLSQMKFVAMLVAIGVQPCSFVDANRVNDEFVAFPVTDRMSHPFGVVRNVVWMFCSVGINNPENTLIFKQNGNHVVGLHELKRRWRLKAAGGPDR